MSAQNLPQNCTLSNSQQRWLTTLIGLTAPIEKYAAALRSLDQVSAAELIRLETDAINATQKLSRATIQPKTEELWYAVFGEAEYHAAARIEIPGYDAGGDK